MEAIFLVSVLLVFTICNIIADMRGEKENISEEITRKFVRWDKTITVAEWETFIRDIIDNAPTVEPTCQNSRQVEPERSQDQWKSNKYGEHFCPRCGNYALYKEEQDNEYYEVQSNFCPECGFELRGGAE